MNVGGNLFPNLQIQPSTYTKNILRVSGMYNRFDGMLWDIYQIKHSNPIVTMVQKIAVITLLIFPLSPLF